jgi:hypothetical protein
VSKNLNNIVPKYYQLREASARHLWLHRGPGVLKLAACGKSARLSFGRASFTLPYEQSLFSHPFFRWRPTGSRTI